MPSANTGGYRPAAKLAEPYSAATPGPPQPPGRRCAALGPAPRWAPIRGVSRHDRSSRPARHRAARRLRRGRRLNTGAGGILNRDSSEPASSALTVNGDGWNAWLIASARGLTLEGV